MPKEKQDLKEPDSKEPALREQVVKAAGVSYLTFDNFGDERIIHGFSLRQGGVSRPPFDSLNLGLHVGDMPQAVKENRRRLAEALCYRETAVTIGQQVHKTSIRVVNRQMAGSGSAAAEDALPETDGLLCAEAGVVLMAHAADCTLLFFFDPVAGCIGLAHAGWRGAVAGMGPLMVEALCKMGCRRENIRAALAPSIGPCCYKVGENVIGAVDGKLLPQVVTQVDGDLYFDLPRLQYLQLLSSGIQRDHLIKSSYCTSCRKDLFYSYRAAGGQTGRMAGVISMKW